MKKTWMIFAGIFACLLLATCSKEVPDSKKVNEILKGERYVRVRLGDSYHQSEVRFDREGDQAVVPDNAEWGLSKYRDGSTVGVNYGEDEGVDIYDADAEITPELYIGNYMKTIEKLDLTAGDVRESNYNVRIVKKAKLDLFEEELSLLSGMVVNDSYELTGVEIVFDKHFRPEKKTFQLQKKEETELGDEEEDSAKCTQEFSYNIGKMRFNWSFEKVQKAIEKEY